MRKRLAQPEENSLLTTKEVCELFNVHETIVYNWRMSFGLPFIAVQSKDFDSVRFDKMVLLVWASKISVFPYRKNKRKRLNENIA